MAFLIQNILPCDFDIIPSILNSFRNVFKWLSIPSVLFPSIIKMLFSESASNAFAINPNDCGFDRVISTNAKLLIVVKSCKDFKPISNKRSQVGLNH